MVTPNGGPTRRTWLLACGTGMAALAGCSAIRDRLEGTEPTLAFDPTVLESLKDRPAPTPPKTFPVAVPGDRFERHRTRAQTLLAAVPEQPDLPNAAMAAELAADRQSVVEAMAEMGNPPRGDRDRLDRWRYRRGQAAEVRGAYSAATGTLDATTFTARREALDSDVTAFTSDWSYRGPDPISSLELHLELETLVGEMRAGTTGWPPFPTHPTDAVFRVGELVATTERSRAALEDVTVLRDRFLQGIRCPRSHRATFSRAAHRLERDLQVTARRHGEYQGREAPPFERDIEDTPAEELYRRVRPRHDDQAVRRALDRGHLAGAIRQAGIGLIGFELLDTVVTEISDGHYGPPATADRVRRERKRALATLRHAWSNHPRAVSRVLAAPALDSLHTAGQVLGRGSLGRREVFELYASYAYARHYAALVPDAADHVQGVLKAAVRS